MPQPSTVEALLRRFRGATPEMLERVLTPYRLRISSFTIEANGRKGAFVAAIPSDVWTTFEQGTTGKVVPKSHVEKGGPWREVIKARILHSEASHVSGELYFAPARVKDALEEVKVGDYMEVDPFGVTSKIESALCEAAFFQTARSAGFAVTRMPENVAKHIGTQNYYDFRLERNDCTYRVELKSLWGTDTTKARLIHTVSRAGGGKNSAREDRQEWPTSSCRFIDQDIFAVSLWLRTGCVTDFAYALSISSTESAEWGLPRVPKFRKHVTQNPAVTDPPSGPWTMDLEEALRRLQAVRTKRP